MRKRTVYLDFDGVLNTYKKWLGEEYLYEPKEGVRDFLEQLSLSYNIIVFTTRNPDLVKTWLEKYNLFIFVKAITNIKEPAWVYVDDRCINFEGDYEKLLEKISSFRPYWQE